MTSRLLASALFFLCACGNIVAQDNPPEIGLRSISVRWTPLGLLDAYDQNLSFGVEHRFKEQWGYGADLAWIFHSAYLNESERSGGYSIRPFVRYYFNKKEHDFIDVELHYKRVAYQLSDWIGRDVINGVAAYEEYTKFDYIKNVYGVHFKIGTQPRLSKNDRWRLEVYTGLGYRGKKQGSEIGEYQPGSWILSKLYEPKFSSVVVLLGARLVFDAKRFQ